MKAQTPASLMPHGFCLRLRPALVKLTAPYQWILPELQAPPALSAARPHLYLLGDSERTDRSQSFITTCHIGGVDQKVAVGATSSLQPGELKKQL